jgi:hypothetical protein
MSDAEKPVLNQERDLLKGNEQVLHGLLNTRYTSGWQTKGLVHGSVCKLS